MVLNEDQRRAFHYEIRNWNNIPIGSQNCGVGCVFCKVNGDPALKRYPALPPISLAELYDGYASLDPAYRFVRLGAGVLVAPHTDPYLHPDIYTFIQHTARQFPGKIVTTVSTGSFIDLDRLDDLLQIPNFGIDLSLITMQPIRERIVPLATRGKLETILLHAPVRKISLMFTGSLLDLERDINALLRLDMHLKCEQILVRRIEHTRFAPSRLLDLSLASIGGYESAVRFLKDHYSAVEYTVPYLSEIYRHPHVEYFAEADARLGSIRRQLEVEPASCHQIVAPDSAYGYFVEHLADYNNAVVHRVPNVTYGGSVTVAGLLTNQDVCLVLDLLDGPGDIVVLPHEMYDDASADLLGASPNDIAERYGTRVMTL
jgi:hypothetical protein